MERPHYLILGGGPAGAALAHLLSSDGYRVLVADPAPYPGFKPCGWAVPRQVEELVRIPREAILTRIRGYRVYLDGKLVFEDNSKDFGYIVDKPALLKALLEGADTVRRGARLGPGLRADYSHIAEPREAVVVAVGSQALASRGDSGRFIYAVQTLAPWRSDYEEDIVEFHFDSGLVGYYWVFPRPGQGLDIGVGGYEEPRSLLRRLYEFTVKLVGEKPGEVRGAWINIGGADPGALEREQPVIGEAAGYVYPLTGEGIRPSMVSAYALYALRVRGDGEPRQHRETVRWISIQRRILDRAVKASPETRRRLLEALPPDVFVELGLGTMSTLKLAKTALKMPAALARIILSSLRSTP